MFGDIPLDGDNPYMNPLPPPPPLAISDEGVRLIKSFEGYGRKLQNGGCCAYQTRLRGGLDIPTIGWGCTVGVTMGMVWTKAQAEEALRREIAKHELAVNSLVKVAINQNQFDACVSLSYNIGTGIGSKNKGFANSSILSNLNAGRPQSAAMAFLKYNRAKGQPEPGLTSRRTRESALFQKPTVAPAEPWMPQGDITPSKEPPHSATVAVASTAAVSGVSYWQQLRDSFSHIFGAAQDPSVLMPVLPSDPLSSAEGFLSTGQRVQSIGTTAWGFRDWLTTQQPLIGVVFLLVLAAIWFRPWAKAD